MTDYNPTILIQRQLAPVAIGDRILLIGRWPELYLQPVGCPVSEYLYAEGVSALLLLAIHPQQVDLVLR